MNIFSGISKGRIISVLAIMVLAAIFAFYGYGRNGNFSDYKFAKVEKGVFTREVSAAGKVASSEKIELRFKNSGKIAELNAKTGNKVKAGEVLVRLDIKEINAQMAEIKAGSDAARAQLGQYEAALNFQEAKLEELKRGARSEEIKIAETSALNAQKSLADAEENFNNAKNKADNDLSNLYAKTRDILNDARTKADDAINTQIANLFSNTSPTSPQLSFTATDSQAKTDSEFQRILAGNSLNSLKSEVDNLPADYSGIDGSLANSKNQLIIMRTFLTRLSAAVNSAAGLSQTALDAYKSSVNTAWTNINTAITNINNQEQLIGAQKIANENSVSSAQFKINEAKNILSSREDSLVLIKAGATSEQISSQEALVDQAKANIASQEAQIKQIEASKQKIQAQTDEMILIAPVDGIISDANGNIGEIIMPSEVAVYMLPSKKLEINADVSEEDIVSVKIGQEARVIFDAFGNDVVWRGKVAQIDPAETIKGGAIYYKTKVILDSDDARIMSGMTADVWIKVLEKDNALFIPSVAIKEGNGGKKLVEVWENNELRQKEVNAGQKGLDGVIEIISGLNEGENVIVSKK